MRVVGTASSPQGFCPDRLAGADRYATAVAVAGPPTRRPPPWCWPTAPTAAWPTPSSSAPLAKARSAALLLTAPTTLPASVPSEITRRKAKTALLVGSTGAISSSVETQLRNLGITSITRFSGADRFATAAAVARAVAPTSPE